MTTALRTTITVRMLVTTAVLGFAATVVADEETIELANGDKITGEVIERTDEHVVVRSAALGEIRIPTSSLAPPADAAEGEAAPDVAKDEKEWHSRFELGATGQFGKSDTQTVTARVTSSRESPKDKTAVEAQYFYDAQDGGDRSNNEAFAQVLQDWYLEDPKWSLFADGRADYDEFQSWEYRLTSHGGAGYYFFKEDDFTLQTRLGAGVLREFNSNDEAIRFEALIGGYLTWKPTEKQDFEIGSTIYPELDASGAFRTVSYAGWSVLMDEEANMTFNVRATHEYQSETDSGIDPNDFKIFVTLGFDF